MRFFKEQQYKYCFFFIVYLFILYIRKYRVYYFYMYVCSVKTYLLKNYVIKEILDQ